MKVSHFLIVIVIGIAINKNIFAGGNPQIIMTAPIDSTSNLLTSKITDQKNDINFNWHQMFTRVPSDYSLFLKNSFNEEEIPTYINLAIITGSLMVFDQTGWKLQHFLYNISIFDQKFSNIAVQMGNGNYQFIISALFASQGIIFHNEKSLKTASNIIESIFSTGLFVQVLKRISGRESPAASTESGGDWEMMPGLKQYQKNQPRYYSFPSGHLSTAAAIMTVIANNYPDVKWIKPVSYSLLGVLSFALVNEGMHWYSDLPLAYFIGYTFGNIVAPVESESNQDRESVIKHFLITPSYNINGVELNATYTF